MAIDTKHAEGRRKVRYQSLDELLADAERFAQQEVHTLGNWSQGQIYQHIAHAMDSSIDGIDVALPAPVRWIISLLMKRKFLYKEIPSGYKAPSKNLLPEETTVEAGLASLRQAIARQKAVPQRAHHPVFGNLGREEWDLFHLRHAEMHMSFIVAVEPAASKAIASEAPA